MSRNLNYKQVANVTRRKWDLETYAQKAKARTAAIKSGKSGTFDGAGGGMSAGDKRPASDLDRGSKEEFVPAASTAPKAHGSQRALLKARSNKVDIDSKVGSVEMVSAEAIATTSTGSGGAGTSNKDGVVKSGVGWHCRVCDCFLKDSHTYLDHINGRKHQKNLGYSMRVERSSKSDVASTMKRILQAKMTKSRTGNDDNITMKNLTSDGENEKTLAQAQGPDYLAEVKRKDEDERRKKEDRKRERKMRKQLKEEAKLKAAAKGQPVQEQAAEDGENHNTHRDVNSETASDKEVGTKESGDDGTELGSGIDPGIAAMMGFSSFGHAPSGR